jgi:hypothetical protein
VAAELGLCSPQIPRLRDASRSQLRDRLAVGTKTLDLRVVERLANFLN